MVGSYEEESPTCSIMARESLSPGKKHKYGQCDHRPDVHDSILPVSISNAKYFLSFPVVAGPVLHIDLHVDFPNGKTDNYVLFSLFCHGSCIPVNLSGKERYVFKFHTQRCEDKVKH